MLRIHGVGVGVIVEASTPQGDCDDCGNESRLPMLVPWTWVRIAPSVVHNEADHRVSCAKSCRCGVLCQRCAEGRLGRELHVGDFAHSIAIGRAVRGPPQLPSPDQYEKVGARVREVTRRVAKTRGPLTRTKEIKG